MWKNISRNKLKFKHDLLHIFLERLNNLFIRNKKIISKKLIKVFLSAILSLKIMGKKSSKSLDHLIDVLLHWDFFNYCDLLSNYDNA